MLVAAKGLTGPPIRKRPGRGCAAKKEYGDFILELEYAINIGGNTGIFIHSALDKNPAYRGQEMQIFDDHGRAPSNLTTGSLYDVVAPTRSH